MFQKKHRSYTSYIILAIVLGCIIGVGVFAYTLIKNIDPATILNTNIVQQEIKKRVGEENAPLVDLLPKLIGMQEPRTYLLLFQNNTEVRPTGGFIGSYALVTVNKGNISLHTLEGSEELDWRAPETWNVAPPKPIMEHLGVSTWYFRDANWDPDFKSSAERALEFYAAEGGARASEIDAVVAIDTEVLTAVLDILGPVTGEGKTFTSANVVELLQYDTSYGFNDRNIPFEDRKRILDALFVEITAKLPTSLVRNYAAYIDAGNRLVREKHIQLYSTDPAEQQTFEARDIAGRVDSVDHDYLMWVDANLAALKTDRVIDRELSYSLSKRADGRMVATAAMTYTHTGSFDWRTSRYRTYARIFVPAGSELISTAGDMRTDRSTDRGRIDQGEQFDKQWFGTFISIEPGQVGTLSFTYLLPEGVITEPYQLLVEKQAGIPSLGLTLDLEFDTNIQSALPAEDQSEWGDAWYRYTDTDLRTDQLFTIEY